MIPISATPFFKKNAKFFDFFQKIMKFGHFSGDTGAFFSIREKYAKYAE